MIPDAYIYKLFLRWQLTKKLKVRDVVGELRNMFVLFSYVRMRCVREIGQTQHWIKKGWENIAAVFNPRFKVNYTRKQFKNHWDSMKNDWKLFKKFRRGHTGIGWNEVTKSIDATEEWWNSRIKGNSAYKKFKGADLSLYWFHYDTLFSYIIATGERARAPNQQSVVGEQSAIDEDFIPTPPGEAGREGSGDSDEDLETNNLFPHSYSTGQKAGSSGTKKKSGAELIRDSLEGVMTALTCKSKSTVSTAGVDNTLAEAIDILDSMEEIEFMSPKYHYTQMFLTKKKKTGSFGSNVVTMCSGP